MLTRNIRLSPNYTELQPEDRTWHSYRHGNLKCNLKVWKQNGIFIFTHHVTPHLLSLTQQLRGVRLDVKEQA
jgi:hypothetical protein